MLTTVPTEYKAKGIADRSLAPDETSCVHDLGCSVYVTASHPRRWKKTDPASINYETILLWAKSEERWQSKVTNKSEND